MLRGRGVLRSMDAFVKKRPRVEDFEATPDEDWTQTLGKVISGGQAGADQAALRAAQTLGYETGGTAAPDFSTSRGQERDLLLSFGLTALPRGSSWEAAYCQRSMKNVDDADATIAFRVKKSPGTDKTVGYCVKKRWTTVPIRFVDGTCEPEAAHRPVLVVECMTSVQADAVRCFLERHKVRVLNVAGHRPWGGRPDWESSIEKFLLGALRGRTLESE